MGILRILLVDDDEASYISLRRALSKVIDRECELEWAQTFEAGLQAMLEQRHDVCLLDYQLGHQNGLDLLRHAMAQGVQTPIIILTGTNDPQVDKEAAQIGAADFLQKDRLDPVLLERSIRYSMQQSATLMALKKSNERVRLLFERSMDGILISDDQGKFVEANSAACSLLDISIERVLESKWGDLFSNSQELQPEPQSDGLEQFEYVRPDGDRRIIEFSACQLAPNLNLTILRDVSERMNLEREILQISEREQRRLGQDLHDGLGQTLTGISCLAKGLEDKLRAKQSDEAEQAGDIARLINEALMQTRQLSRGLCPVVLEKNDIQAALRQLAENVKTFFGVVCETNLDTKVRIADNAVAVHLYRVAQEATTNAIKHGRAKHIHLSLFRSGFRVVLRIQDDGLGFPRAQTKQKGMGLRVMRHRARTIGAVLTIRPAKKGGTIVSCSLRKNPLGRRTPELEAVSAGT